jgi:ribosomal-protein-serine acetyltransferase
MMKTGDVIIKRIDLSSAREIFDLVESCRGYLTEWLPWVNYSTQKFHTEKFIQESMEGDIFKPPKRRIFEICFQNKIAGLVDIHNGDAVNKKAEIGYWLAEKFQGNGLATEACSQVVDHGFDMLDLNRLTIKCSMENEKCRAIPERLGFVNEGIEREGACLNGEFADVIVYSGLRKDWQKKMTINRMPINNSII